MPSEDQIDSLTVEQIPEALSKIETLKQMHADNFQMWHMLEDLEIKVLHRSRKLREQSDSSEQQPAPEAANE